MKNIWLAFQNKSIEDKLKTIRDNNIISEEYYNILKNEETLPLDVASQMAENCIGAFSLPFSISPYFIVDGENVVVPMVTEEPSVVAACSYASKIVSKCGGFTTKIHNRKMIGEVSLFNVKNIDEAIKIIEENENKILNMANDSHPSIVKRGGGAEKIYTKVIKDNEIEFLVVYLVVDVQEAMGANIVNNMLEGIKLLLEELTEGEALIAILSNYATESIVTSKCSINIKYLSNDKNEAIKIAKKIELASKFAKADIYRAVTHNKGIFNGIDAVVIATGNDFRAIEAGGHAYAVKNGRYEGLTTWNFDEEKGVLNGELSLPMPIGTVGGSIGLNPTVKVAFNMLNNLDAKKLASVIVSVGLAQNLAAIKALVSTGIQKGHMKLQAKSLALFAGATPEQVDKVVEKLLESKYMNLETAKKILDEMKFG